MSAPTACGEHTRHTDYTAATLTAPDERLQRIAMATTLPRFYYYRATLMFFTMHAVQVRFQAFRAPGERCINSMIPLRQVPWCNFNQMGRAAQLGIMVTKNKTPRRPYKSSTQRRHIPKLYRCKRGNTVDQSLRYFNNKNYTRGIIIYSRTGDGHPSQRSLNFSDAPTQKRIDQSLSKDRRG